MKRFIYSILVLFLFCKPAPAPVFFESNLKEIRTIKETDERFFIHPYDIEVGINGDIYIADDGRMEIQVFDNTGQFKRVIGSRGRGPGEFTKMSGMGIFGSNIYVADYNLKHINIFDTTGDFKRVELLKNYNLGVSEISRLGNNNVFQRITSKDINTAYFAELYSSDFDSLLGAIISAKEVYKNLPNEIFQTQYWNTGSLLVSSERRIFFAPTYYEGVIYEYVYDPWIKSWIKNQEISGFVENVDSYIPLKSNSNRTPDIVSNSLGQSDQLIFAIRNLSKGLYNLNDGRIVHFTMIDLGEEKVLGFELFNADLKYLGYSILKKKPINIGNGKMNAIMWDIKEIDKQNNVYVIDSEISPQIRIFNLTVPKF